MADLSTRQITQLKTEFLALDDNKDGTISTAELGKLLSDAKGKLKMNDKDITRMLYDFDQDGSGTIEIDEFIKAMANKKEKDIIFKAFSHRSAIRKQKATE